MMRRLVFIFAFLVGFAEPTIAGTYNYRSVLIGERAAAMGGAYLALSDSSEGGYYNPAGLAFVEQSSLSVAGNFYSLTRGTRKNALTFAGSTSDLSANSFNSIPQIASFAQRIRLPGEDKDKPERNAVAFTVALTELIDQSGRLDFNVPNGQALLTRDSKDQTLYVGPSFARKYGDKLAFGVSFFFVLRMLQSNGFILQDTAATLAQGYREDRQTIGGLAGLAGVRYSPLENFWVGLTYGTSSLRLYSTGSTFFSAIGQDKSKNVTTHSGADQKDLEPNNPIPHKIGLGLAYEKKQRYTVAFDSTFHFPNSYTPFENLTATAPKQRFLTNYSVGGEYYVTPSFPFRAGFFTNLSSAPEVQKGTTSQPDQVDYYGFSLAACLERQNTTISLGTVIQFGNGNAVDNLGNKIAVRSDIYAALLAGSYKF